MFRALMRLGTGVHSPVSLKVSHNHRVRVSPKANLNRRTAMVLTHRVSRTVNRKAKLRLKARLNHRVRLRAKLSHKVKVRVNLVKAL